jgi:hypothetical protein
MHQAVHPLDPSSTTQRVKRLTVPTYRLTGVVCRRRGLSACTHGISSLMMAVRRGSPPGRAKAGDRLANTDTCGHGEEKARAVRRRNPSRSRPPATVTLIGTSRTRKGAPDRDKTASRACIRGLRLALASGFQIADLQCAGKCV